MASNDNGNDAIHVDPELENEFIKREKLFGGFKLRKLRQIKTEYLSGYLSNPKNDQYQPVPQGWQHVKFRTVTDREYKLTQNLNYTTWLLNEKSIFASSTRIS